MNQTSVPTDSLDELLERLTDRLEAMSPQLRKAAAHVLDHPASVGFSSVRALAHAAKVKPNTLVRMAQAVGFAGFDDFRQPFRAAMQARAGSFQDRAQSLQELSAGGRLGALYADVATAVLTNVEDMFAGASSDQFAAVAERILTSRRTYVIGVGANYALAHNFAYLVGMAIDHVEAVPDQGNAAMDSIVRASDGDVVIGMTFAPYRSEVVEAVQAARAQGAFLVAITDSHGSPIAVGADEVIIAPTTTPQFFPSTLAAASALEALASFVVADSSPEVVESIDRFHRRRYALGVYWEDT